MFYIYFFHFQFNQFLRRFLENYCMQTWSEISFSWNNWQETSPRLSMARGLFFHSIEIIVSKGLRLRPTTYHKSTLHLASPLPRSSDSTTRKRLNSQSNNGLDVQRNSDPIGTPWHLTTWATSLGLCVSMRCCQRFLSEGLCIWNCQRKNYCHQNIGRKFNNSTFVVRPIKIHHLTTQHYIIYHL